MVASRSLDGKVVAITGAGRGIGREGIAEELLPAMGPLERSADIWPDDPV